MKRHAIARTGLVLGLAGLLGCASTQVLESWKNPEMKTPLKFQRVVVMAISPDEGVRRNAEDEIVKRIGADKATPAYLILKKEDLKDSAKVKAEIEKTGADGAVTLRLVDVRQETNYVPGSYMPMSAPFYSYSSWAWDRSFQPGYLTTDTLARIETSIYSVKDEKLLWSGITETFNPGTTSNVVKGVADAVQKELVKQQLLEKTAK